jgi:hypothetical protein
LALFALALQFALSFGHFHVGVVQAAPSLQQVSDLVHAIAPDTAGQRQPPAGHDDQPSHEPCTICAVMAMASQATLAIAAALPLPDAPALTPLATRAGHIHPSDPRPAFQSRAPPVS